MPKTSPPFKSVNLDEAINFENKMSQCKIKKYLEKEIPLLIPLCQLCAGTMSQDLVAFF
jgi:hypothetical protein